LKNDLVNSCYSWLSFFALASLGDKILLKQTPKPKLYAFYVGFLNILAVF